MKRETAGEKWDRLKSQVQEGILNGYPNPQREGCPGPDAIRALAAKSANIDDDAIEADPQWQHVTHCSPCYRDYLEQFERVQLGQRPARSKVARTK